MLMHFAMDDKRYVKYILNCKNYKATQTAFVEEQRLDKPKKKIRYFVDILQSALQTNDLDYLNKVWKEYELLYIKFMDFGKQKQADFLKSELLKAYLVECCRNKRHDKIGAFFQSMGSYMLANISEWSDWFEFPFTKVAVDHKIFNKYFTRVWMDNLFMSLFNFFMQVIRFPLVHESHLEKFFMLEARMSNVLDEFENCQPDYIRRRFSLPAASNDQQLIFDRSMDSSLSSMKFHHDVSELMCDFRLVSENKQVEVRNLSRINKPKGLSVIIQNKSKASSPNTIIRKKMSANSTTNEIVEIRENPEKPIETNYSIKENISVDFQLYQNDSDSFISVTPVLSTGSTPVVTKASPTPGSSDTFGIKQLSSKLSQKIFKPKATFESSKPVIYHEHFSMITHAKFCRVPNPYWASLDVGGTFKVWCNSEGYNKSSINNLSFKHTIYSFDWVACSTDLILLGTKGGSVKLFNLSQNEIIDEMLIDTSHPRINIVQSFDTESKFVCESIDRSRSNSPASSLPQGLLSLYDAGKWSPIRTHLFTFNSKFTINCLTTMPNVVIAGCSNGTVQLIDTRSFDSTGTQSFQLFTDEEVINIAGSCQSKWPLSSLDSNMLVCLGSKCQIKTFDVRQPKEEVACYTNTLSDLTLPLSWIERPNGGEQTVHIPRSNLISLGFLGSDVLLSGGGKGISVHKLSETGMSDSTCFGSSQNSPITCVDSSLCNASEKNSVSILAGSMEGTISMLKVNVNKS